MLMPPLDDDDEWELEDIVKEETIDNKPHFLVK